MLFSLIKIIINYCTNVNSKNIKLYDKISEVRIKNKYNLIFFSQYCLLVHTFFQKSVNINTNIIINYLLI